MFRRLLRLSSQVAYTQGTYQSHNHKYIYMAIAAATATAVVS